MYEFYPKEKLLKMFPILETDADMIINFVSCDGVMGYKLSAVISSLNPDLKYKFQNQCADGHVSKGKISITQKGLPKINKTDGSSEIMIAHIPFKNTFKEQPSLDFLIEGFKKLEFACNSKINVGKIAIQKGIIADELLMESLKGLTLPEIIFYDEYDYYAELERETALREEAEKAELLLQKQAALEEKEKAKLEKERIKKEKELAKEEKERLKKEKADEAAKKQENK